MKTEEKDGYKLLSFEGVDFNTFKTSFTNEHTKFVNDNIIIYLSSKLNVVEDDISVFLEYAAQHQKNGTTFVVVYPNVDVDVFPETFNIVPTLQEAEDVLEMENIQRDLGF